MCQCKEQVTLKGFTVESFAKWTLRKNSGLKKLGSEHFFFSSDRTWFDLRRGTCIERLPWSCWKNWNVAGRGGGRPVFGFRRGQVHHGSDLGCGRRSLALWRAIGGRQHNKWEKNHQWTYDFLRNVYTNDGFYILSFYKLYTVLCNIDNCDCDWNKTKLPDETIRMWHGAKIMVADNREHNALESS